MKRDSDARAGSVRPPNDIWVNAAVPLPMRWSRPGERMQAEAAAGAVRGGHAREGGASMSLPDGSAQGCPWSRSPECARPVIGWLRMDEGQEISNRGLDELPHPASVSSNAALRAAARLMGFPARRFCAFHIASMGCRG
jgi:hypothetical protein